MSARPQLASYGGHIPDQIDPDAYDSVVEMLEEAMQRFAGKPAFRCFGQTLTYADTASRATSPPTCSTGSS